jgi:hypothetical protein
MNKLSLLLLLLLAALACKRKQVYSTSVMPFLFLKPIHF